MKNTRYFDDYQSAYNYYGGNIVPSNEIALIGNGSYIFVSSDNAVSGNTQYYDANLTNDEIVETMTYTAYNNGVTYGEAIGFETGYTAGTTYGEAIGYAQGYEGGYSYGYSYGYTEGEAAGGMTLTDVQVEQMSMGMFMTGNEAVSNSGTFLITTSGMDSEYIKARINAEMGLYIDKYNTTDGLVDISTSLDVTITYHEDGDDGYISAIMPLVTGDKVGFGFYSIETDPETGDIAVSSISSQYLKDVWIDGTGYKHFHDIATTGNYEARWQLSTDPESGDTVNEFTLEEVVQP